MTELDKLLKTIRYLLIAFLVILPVIGIILAGIFAFFEM